jgi:hypothetical protein
MENIDKKLQDWETINKRCEEYIHILYKTQEIVPVNSGNRLHSYHSDYNIDGIIYRLTWEFSDSKSSEPTMQKKI